MNPVDELIDLFGGTFRECARKLGEKNHSTLQTWKNAGSIPHYRRHQVRAAAEEFGVEIPADLWNRLFPSAQAA
jgi:hypothetical protein